MVGVLVVRFYCNINNSIMSPSAIFLLRIYRRRLKGPLHSAFFANTAPWRNVPPTQPVVPPPQWCVGMIQRAAPASSIPSRPPRPFSTKLMPIIVHRMLTLSNYKGDRYWRLVDGGTFPPLPVRGSIDWTASRMPPAEMWLCVTSPLPKSDLSWVLYSAIIILVIQIYIYIFFPFFRFYIRCIFFMGGFSLTFY